MTFNSQASISTWILKSKFGFTRFRPDALFFHFLDSGVEKIKQIEHYTLNPKEPIDEDTAPA